MKRISAIICAYNEAKTIKEVVTTACDYFFDEVIVVNDGSTDATSKILGELQFLPSLKYIELPENKGKGYAMTTGIDNSTGEIIVFIDADLSNLKEEHFEQLINPVLSKEADMVLGQATETLINYRINPFKSLSGQRSLSRKDILPILEDMKTTKFGVETLINLYYQAYEKRVKYVMLNDLEHPTKFDKTSQSQAIKEFIFEGHQIALTAFNNFSLITKAFKNQIKNIKM
jgi:glycosyltransferase involved in cell wall biosynthesis